MPNTVSCISSNEKIDCVFFNSYEGYIKKLLPINREVIVYGKINFYKGKYQVTNPKIVTKNEEGIIKDLKNYSLTEGLKITKYNKIIEEVLRKLPDLKEWHSLKLLEKFNNVTWKQSIEKIHKFKPYFLNYSE